MYKDPGQTVRHDIYSRNELGSRKTFRVSTHRRANAVHDAHISSVVHGVDVHDRQAHAPHPDHLEHPEAEKLLRSTRCQDVRSHITTTTTSTSDRRTQKGKRKHDHTPTRGGTTSQAQYMQARTQHLSRVSSKRLSLPRLMTRYSRNSPSSTRDTTTSTLTKQGQQQQRTPCSGLEGGKEAHYPEAHYAHN